MPPAFYCGWSPPLYGPTTWLKPSRSTGTEPNDIVIADRGFCSYAHLCCCGPAFLPSFACISGRSSTFAKGGVTPPRAAGRGRRAAGQPRSRWVRSLGKHDQIVEYSKPQQRPKWMTREDFAQLPDSILVRELRYRVTRRGSRVREVTLVTTLLDAELDPAADLAKLYAAGSRDQSAAPQANAADGCVAHEDRRWSAQRAGHVRHRLQSRALVMLRSATPDIPVTRISFIDAQRWLSHAPSARLENSSCPTVPIASNPVSKNVDRKSTI